MYNRWLTYSDELYHHGVKGQKWGVRRYRDENGRLTALGNRKRINMEVKGDKALSEGRLQKAGKYYSKAAKIRGLTDQELADKYSSYSKAEKKASKLDELSDDSKRIYAEESRLWRNREKALRLKTKMSSRSKDSKDRFARRIQKIAKKHLNDDVASNAARDGQQFLRQASLRSHSFMQMSIRQANFANQQHLASVNQHIQLHQSMVNNSFNMAPMHYHAF